MIKWLLHNILQSLWNEGKETRKFSSEVSPVTSWQGKPNIFEEKINKTSYNYAESLDEESSKWYKKKLCVIGIAVNYMEEALSVHRIIYFAYQGLTSNTFSEDFANVINEWPHIGYFFPKF